MAKNGSGLSATGINAMNVVACSKSLRDRGFLEASPIVDGWDDGTFVQKKDLGIIILCEILFVMLMMDTQCISL